MTPTYALYQDVLDNALKSLLGKFLDDGKLEKYIG